MAPDKGLRPHSGPSTATVELEGRLRQLIALCPGGVVTLQGACIIEADHKAARMLAFTNPGPLIGRRVANLVHPEDRVRFNAFIGSLSDSPTTQPCELRLISNDGGLLEASLVGAAISYRGAPAIQLVVEDLTTRNATRRLLAHQALHDPLTGFPSRVLLVDRLRQAIARIGRSDEQVAVLFCDVDRFKAVNDSLGRDAGDELLVAVSRRLRVSIRPGDTVARFGGDEFVILCESIGGIDDATAIVQRVTASLSEPFTVGGEEISVTASIGVSLGTNRLADPNELIRDADAAMVRAKDLGSGGFEISDGTTHERALGRIHIESALRRALEEDQLEVFYQPIVTLSSGVLHGVEALLRWHHPERGMILPGQFIPVAEDSDLIVSIGTWVLEKAALQATKWEALLGTDQSLKLSVNLSARQLLQPDLVQNVRRLLAEGLVKPSQVTLCLEVTETSLVRDTEQAGHILKDLCDIGVSIGIDDFGTGYSSLSYLKRFPVTTIKVDQSFIAGIDEVAHDRTIVSAIIDLAHALGLVVVAEGVERPEQLATLTELGCDMAQGFLFERPLTAKAVEELLEGSFPNSYSHLLQPTSRSL